MPRYHLNFYSAKRLVIDEEGSEFASLEDAIELAMSTFREMAAIALNSTNPNVPTRVVVTDAAGEELATFAAATALPEQLRA
jgi:hypothetical protein